MSVKTNICYLKCVLGFLPFALRNLKRKKLGGWDGELNPEGILDLISKRNSEEVSGSNESDPGCLSPFTKRKTFPLKKVSSKRKAPDAIQ